MHTRRITLAVAALALTSSVAVATTGVAAMWMGKVAGKDGSGISGAVEMNPGSEANTTVVTLNLKGDTPSTTRPWHIHIGSCSKPGGVLGGGRSYTPVAGDANGAGTSKATLALALPDTGSYYVNIHDSPANMAKIVACGDLMLHKM